MKICFLSHNFKPSYLLHFFKKMTPNRSGMWRDMEAVINPNDADYLVIIDETSFAMPDRPKIYLGAHPPGTTSYRDMRGQKDAWRVLDQSETLGFCEWWLKTSYDTLNKMTLNSQDKKHKLVCILSNSDDRPYHQARINHVDMLCKKGVLTELYGRIRPTPNMKPYYRGELGFWHYKGDESDCYWFGKESVLRESISSLEYDAHPTINYISERVFDAMLMWCRPLYWGSTNMEKYLPKGSFQYINAYGDHTETKERLEEPIDYNAMQEARDLMLNKYQIWPRVYEVIKKG